MNRIGRRTLIAMAVIACAAAVLIPAGYVLDRGILIGSEVQREPAAFDGRNAEYVYAKHCYYLHFAGIDELRTSSATEHRDIDRYVCQMFSR
jgi:hypothetical protein